MDKKIRLVMSPLGQVVIPQETRRELPPWLAQLRRLCSPERLATLLGAALILGTGVCSFLVMLAEHGW